MRDINRVMQDNCISHVTDGGGRGVGRGVPRGRFPILVRHWPPPVGTLWQVAPTSWRTGGRGLSVGLLSVSRLAPTAPRQLVATHSSRGTSGGLLFGVGVSAQPPRAARDNTDLHSSASTHSPTGSSVVPTFRPWACSCAMAALASSFCSGVWYQIPDLLDGESVLCSSWRGGRTHVLTTAPSPALRSSGYLRARSRGLVSVSAPGCAAPCRAPWRETH